MKKYSAITRSRTQTSKRAAPNAAVSTNFTIMASVGISFPTDVLRCTSNAHCNYFSCFVSYDFVILYNASN